MVELNTFSITARCARTGQLGVAAATGLPAVGMLCPFVRAGVGAVATQSFVNPYLGIWGLDLLAQGGDAGTVKELLLGRDPEPRKRQFTLVDRWGNSGAHTGEESDPWRGHLTGEDFAAAGNLLDGEEVLRSMVEIFRSTPGQPLVERLILALEAGQDAGGDRRGGRSAAVKVAYREDYPYLDLRVDQHPDPVSELRKTYEVVQRDLLPLLPDLPTRASLAEHSRDLSEGR